MQYVFEYPNSLNLPYECFLFDANKSVFPIAPHWHYFTELIYMLKGTAQVDANGHTYYLQAGDLIIFYPRVVHSIYATALGPLEYVVLKFDAGKMTMNTIYSPNVYSILEAASNSPYASPLIRADEIHSVNVNDIMNICMKEMSERTYGYDIIMQAKIHELMTWIIRKWKHDGFIMNDKLLMNQKNGYSINTITEYIDKNSGSTLNIKEIAQLCNMSYSFFAKKFQAIYGNTCKEYITQTRLRKVQELLTFTEFDLNFISQETGFADCSHMIKAFKTAYGVTPKQYRIHYRVEGQFN